MLMLLLGKRDEGASARAGGPAPPLPRNSHLPKTMWHYALSPPVPPLFPPAIGSAPYAGLAILTLRAVVPRPMRQPHPQGNFVGRPEPPLPLDLHAQPPARPSIVLPRPRRTPASRRCLIELPQTNLAPRPKQVPQNVPVLAAA